MTSDLGRPPAVQPGDHGLAIGYQRIEAMDANDATAQFDHAGYLALPGLLTESALGCLQQEAAKLEKHAKRRDFLMECMGGTPRHMTTLGGLEIAEAAPVIAALYRDSRLVNALGTVVGLEIQLAADPVERHVLNILHQSGDTHGLHTDDYPLALVMFLQSPSCEEGCGHLEFFSACQAAGDAVETSQKSHAPGDAYLLRADKFPHRVQPIHDGCVRTVLNFAYGASSIPICPTPSASILYS